MLKNIVLLIFFLLFQVSSTVAESSPGEVPAEIKSTWQHFLKVMSQKDPQALRLLSLNAINCRDCLDNTEQEQAEMQRLRMTPEFQDVIQTKRHIPIAQFYKEDVPIIFTSDFIRRLLHNKTVFSLSEQDGQTFCEVIVDVYPRVDKSEYAEEGQQYVFDFIKTKSGLKFSGIHTVP